MKVVKFRFTYVILVTYIKISSTENILCSFDAIEGGECEESRWKSACRIMQVLFLSENVQNNDDV